MNITIALQNNLGLSYFQEIFHVKTVFVSGVRYWEALHLCTNSCILAHCMLNKKIFVRDIELFFFSVYRIAHGTILKNFGPTQCINSLRIAKRHYMTLKLYIHPYTVLCVARVLKHYNDSYITTHQYS